MVRFSSVFVPAIAMLAAAACSDPPEPFDPDHGPIAPDISAPLGEPIPTATPEQLETFERGRAVATRRFDLAEGLGPSLNVTSCAACHERPTTGGAAGLYRNFFIAGTKLEGEPFRPQNGVMLFDCGDAETDPADRERNPPPESDTGAIAGVIRQFSYAPGQTARPDPRVDPTTDLTINVVGQRNPIPFFGVGLIAELTEEEILSRADPDDADRDGISGRPNFAEGFVGRFGMKSQTTSIEGFIRGPLFNHLGISTDPLSEEQRARLPVDSSSPDDSDGSTAIRYVAEMLRRHAQAAAPGTPNCDFDAALDPELSTDDLFDLVSFSMLLAAPEIEPLNAQRRRGMTAFNVSGCGGCHAPRLQGPRGPLPVYSDLLLHDMGPDLADNLVFLEATGSEFRTQPLWGLAAVGPYLHDGRASTIDEAIRWHGGEAERARIAYENLSDTERGDLLEFLLSLGGRNQASGGLLPPNAPVPDVGDYGGPRRALSATEAAAFLEGRIAFDRDHGRDEGVGGPRMNGDSCRACHFDPVIGGAGPRGVNVMRHGIINDQGEFVPPTVGTVLHKTTRLGTGANFPQPECTVFEHRQAPPLFGLGMIDEIADATILANADPNDVDGDGISGKASLSDGGRLGRFGWKAQVPSLAEFVRDAVSTELGMTLAPQQSLTFGKIQDNDEIADPEFSPDEAAGVLTFMTELAPPPRQVAKDPTAAAQGETLFDTVGCTGCHIQSLTGADGPVPLYSDLLLHEILPDGAQGIEEFSANVREFRTPPLWGVSRTAPYLHSGAADTLDEAIRAHDGEALTVRAAYEALSDADRSALIQFLETL